MATVERPRQREQLKPTLFSFSSATWLWHSCGAEWREGVFEREGQPEKKLAELMRGMKILKGELW